MERSRLMVVDDDEDVAVIICRIAQNLGFDTQTASGARALSACEAFNPDVIVLDIFMPEIDGFEVLHYVGHHLKHTSVIIVSGKDASFRVMAERMCEQEQIPIIANVAKPFSVDLLYTVLTDAKRRHPSHVGLSFAWVDTVLHSA